MKKEVFQEDEVLKRALVRSLEVIGEAVKKLPLDFREKYNHVDWKAIAGMRDKLIHDYAGVDYDLVWDVVINEIPLFPLVLESLDPWHSARSGEKGANSRTLSLTHDTVIR